MSKMIIKVIFMQRKEQHEGQHAPEIWAATDEFAYEEDSEWFEDQLELARKALKGDFSGMAVIDIEVDQDEIRRRLGQMPPLKGEIQDGQEG